MCLPTLAIGGVRTAENEPRKVLKNFHFNHGKILAHSCHDLTNFVRYLDTRFSISNFERSVIRCIKADLRDQKLVGALLSLDEIYFGPCLHWSTNSTHSSCDLKFQKIAFLKHFLQNVRPFPRPLFLFFEFFSKFFEKTEATKFDKKEFVKTRKIRQNLLKNRHFVLFRKD